MSVIANLNYKPLLLLLLIGGIGCSGSSKAVDPIPEEKPFALGEYETFDASAYPNAPLPEGIDVVHEVPASLMVLDASPIDRRPRRVQGYRIQIYASLDRNAANDVVERVIVWWEGLSKKGNKGIKGAKRGANGAPVYLAYEKPRYKVRIGNFISRQEAKDILIEARAAFGNGFLVPTKILR